MTRVGSPSSTVRNLKKVISGGQTGVDQAALRAARDAGLQVGGWCPPERECEAGAIPADFPLKETERECSPNAPDVPRSQRTEWNVRDSDGTLVIRGGAATGVEWTIECAGRYKRPLLVCDVDDAGATDAISRWLAANGIGTLNVAGPAESTSPGIGNLACTVLRRVFNL
jgi:predicted Rossmann-fold nucleotide-binding protein